MDTNEPMNLFPSNNLTSSNNPDLASAPINVANVSANTLPEFTEDQVLLFGRRLEEMIVNMLLG